VPLPPDAMSEVLGPADISTLILLPADEELEPNQGPQAPKASLSEPRRLEPSAVESAKAVRPSEPAWSAPLPASGWKTAKPVSTR
jgi:hypothetical protein